jgi:c-di-GMP-binding flagellar brake protein YcgR
MTIETHKKPAVHDHVLVEAEIDGALVGFRAVIVNVMPAALWLGLVKSDPQLERLRPEDPIQLTFRRDGAAMVAASTFLSHMGSTQSRLFSIEWPEDYRLIQRRSYLRLDTECPVEYLVTSQSEAGGAGQTGEGVTTNISAGGLQFKVCVPIEDAVRPGDQLEIRLSLNRGAVLAEAEVVRVDDATNAGPDGHPLPPGKKPRGPVTLVAVRFVSISIGAEDRIVRHIFAVQRRARSESRKALQRPPAGGYSSDARW